VSEPILDRSISSVCSSKNISRSIRPAPQLCDLTPILATQNNQAITTGRSPLHPVATTRSMTPLRTTSNGRPHIPPNRPNVQPTQFQKDVRNGTNTVNKLRDKQTAIMGMFINPNAGPRGKFRRI